MSRIVVLAASVVLLMPAVALADTGYEAEFTMTITFDPSAMGQLGGQQAGAGAAVPSFPPQVYAGTVWWTSGNMRTDMQVKHPAGELMQITTIVDNSDRVAYQVMHRDKVAIKTDLDGMPGDVLGMGTGPEQFFDIEKSMARYDQMPGAKVEKLGTEQVGDRQCQKVHVTVDPQAALPEEGADPRQRGFTALLGDIELTLWIAEDLGVAVKAETATGGSTLLWEMLDVASWEGTEQFFAVPEGYEVVDLEDMMAQGGPLPPPPPPGR